MITVTLNFTTVEEMLAHFAQRQEPVALEMPTRKTQTEEETRALFTERHPSKEDAPEASTPMEKTPPKRKAAPKAKEPAPAPEPQLLTFSDDVKPLLRQAWQKMGAAAFSAWTIEHATPAGLVGEDGNWFKLDGASQDDLMNAVDLLKGAL